MHLLTNLLIMQERYSKYFWDGKTGWSDTFILQRVIESASFEDLIMYPFDEVKINMTKIRLQKIRTAESRKMFIQLIAAFINTSNSWEEAIDQMISDAIHKNKKYFDYTPD